MCRNPFYPAYTHGAIARAHAAKGEADLAKGHIAEARALVPKSAEEALSMPEADLEEIEGMLGG